MDWSAIGAITASIATARDVAKGLVATRDWNLVAEKEAVLLDHLLKAQQGLFAHNAALLQLQHEHFEAREKIRALEEAARERGRYTLVRLGSGGFAYGMNITPQQSRTGEPTDAEPPHYVCQSCFDLGRKVVLDYTDSGGSFSSWTCHACERRIYV